MFGTKMMDLQHIVGLLLICAPMVITHVPAFDLQQCKILLGIWWCLFKMMFLLYEYEVQYSARLLTNEIRIYAQWDIHMRFILERILNYE